MGWQGNREERYYQMASTGYLTAQELAGIGIPSTDDGWYGKGIYFTQRPRCVRVCVRFLVLCLFAFSLTSVTATARSTPEIAT